MGIDYKEITDNRQYYKYCQHHLELGKILKSNNPPEQEKREQEYYILGLIIDDYNRKYSKLESKPLKEGSVKSNIKANIPGHRNAPSPPPPKLKKDQKIFEINCDTCGHEYVINESDSSLKLSLDGTNKRDFGTEKAYNLYYFNKCSNCDEKINFHIYFWVYPEKKINYQEIEQINNCYIQSEKLKNLL